jgi:hypothetical protein
MLRLQTFCILLWVLPSSIMYGQSLDNMLKTLNTTQVTYAHGDSIEVITIIKEKRDFKVLNDRFYYWYSNNQIKSTAGGYAGKVLDGDYRLFNRNKDLLQAGHYKLGLRTGEWKSWYTNGVIAKQERWRRGIPEGPFIENYPSGLLKRSGMYKRGLLHGKVYQYSSSGQALTEKYRNGELIVPKTKKNNRSKKDPKENTPKSSETENSEKKKTIKSIFKPKNKIKDTTTMPDTSLAPPPYNLYHGIPEKQPLEK